MVNTIFDSPGRFQRIAEKAQKAQKELKEERRFIPSQLTKTSKAELKMEIGEGLSKARKTEREAKKEKKSIEKARAKLEKKISTALRKTIKSRKLLKKSQFPVDLRQGEPIRKIFDQPSQFFQSQLGEDIDEMNLFLK